MNESIFNYNVTSNELRKLAIPLTEKEYLNSTSKIRKFYDLHSLFILRGDEEKAREILVEASSSLRLTNSL